MVRLIPNEDGMKVHNDLLPSSQIRFTFVDQCLLLQCEKQKLVIPDHRYIPYLHISFCSRTGIGHDCTTNFVKKICLRTGRGKKFR